MSVKENLERILKDIEGYNPIVIAVTKYCGASKMKEAFDAGLRHFGENKAQDALKKIHEMDDTIKCQSIYHFIGHLQTNKVKYVVGEFEYIHSVDSLKLAHLIDDLAGKIGIKQKILVQVNNAEEPQKFGVAPKELDNLIMQIRRLNHIELKGLMNMAPLGCETSRLEELFSQMKTLQMKYELDELSMGMSNDYKIAAKCGATMIRVGRILFE